MTDKKFKKTIHPKIWRLSNGVQKKLFIFLWFLLLIPKTNVKVLDYFIYQILFALKNSIQNFNRTCRVVFITKAQ